MDRKRQRIINSIVAAIVIIVCVIVLIVSFVIKSRIENEIAGSTTEKPSTPSVEQPEEKPTPPGVNEITEAKFIDLQPTVDKWISTLSYNEKTGVVIYDLNNSRTAASYHENEVFNVASLYKLLFAYDGYRQIAIGAEQPTNIIVKNSDKGELTLSECLDLIIRESYNGCADVMRNSTLRASRVNSLIRNLEMTSTSNLGLQSTAADITKLMRTYWRHSELPQSLWAQLSDSMLNQPPSATTEHPTYDWRQGLPAGFSSEVNVYNKVGWEWNGERWNIYADAAIVDFVELKHEYIVVVLTSNFTSASKISRLGQMIEETVVLQSDGIIK